MKAQIKTYAELVGKWEIVGEGMQGATLEIIDSSNIYLTYDGQRKKAHSISLDTRRNPAWFDFSVPDSTDSTPGDLRIKTLLQVYGNGVMKWQLFLDDERSEYFTASKGEMFYLKKSKAETGAVASQE
jgi:hypothetical protein